MRQYIDDHRLNVPIDHATATTKTDDEDTRERTGSTLPHRFQGDRKLRHLFNKEVPRSVGLPVIVVVLGLAAIVAVLHHAPGIL